MTRLHVFAAFAAAARHASFAAAARELGLTASAVAKSVARFEDDLGLRLFHRTTRQVTLTSEGHELYERCRRIVDEIEALRDEASGARAEPGGTLRLNAPIVLGRTLVVPALAALVRQHPRIALDVGFSDRYVDLVSDGLDAAVRIGHLPDSTLVARPIGAQQLVVCASPRYLRRRGTPVTPADLGAHACLVFRNPTTGRPRPWQLRDGDRPLELSPASSAVLGDGEALVAAAAAGMGLAQVPDYMAAEAMRRGQVAEVLARYRPAPVPISVVYPRARRVTPRLRALIAALAAAGADRPPTRDPGARRR